MKNTLRIFLIIFLISAIIMVIRFIQENISFDKSLSLEELPVTLDNVNIEIKKETLTKKGATVIITNKSDSKIAFGEYYRIDKKEDQKWTKMKSINKNDLMILNINEIEGEKSIEKNIDWSELYGTLRKGDYRLVKEIYGQKQTDGVTIGEYIAVEFIIE